MITQDELVACFTYDQGRLICNNGEELHTNADGSGHIQVWYKERLRAIHRLIFLYHYGFLPDFIDHINRDPSDNRIENLRPISRSYNRINSDIIHGAVPIKGVHRHGKRYRARIRKNGKLYCLGIHDTAEAAGAAYDKAREELFPGAYYVPTADKPTLDN